MNGYDPLDDSDNPLIARIKHLQDWANQLEEDLKQANIGTQVALKLVAEEMEKSDSLKKLIQKLLNKVNMVTAYHRHGEEVGLEDLTELSNRQIEVESELYKLTNKVNYKKS